MTLPGNQRTHDLILSAVPAGVWLASETRLTFGHDSPSHHHEVTQILIMVDGGMSLLLDDDADAVTLPPQTIVAIPPGVMHRVVRSTHRRVGLMDLRLDLSRFPPLDQLLAGGAVRRSQASAAQVRAAVDDLAQAASSAEPRRTVQIISMVWRVACLLLAEGVGGDEGHGGGPAAVSDPLAQGDPRAQGDGRVRAVDSFLREHLHEPIGLPELAAAARISASQLNRHFRAVLNTTPAKYLETRRIEHALELLAVGTYTVKEVSALCGFQGVPQFHRTFKRLTGRTPRQIMQKPSASRSPLIG